jgi:hypothetical protein
MNVLTIIGPDQLFKTVINVLNCFFCCLKTLPLNAVSRDYSCKLCQIIFSSKKAGYELKPDISNRGRWNQGKVKLSQKRSVLFYRLRNTLKNYLRRPLVNQTGSFKSGHYQPSNGQNFERLILSVLSRLMNTVGALALTEPDSNQNRSDRANCLNPSRRTLCPPRQVKHAYSQEHSHWGDQQQLRIKCEVNFYFIGEHAHLLGDHNPLSLQVSRSRVQRGLA